MNDRLFAASLATLFVVIGVLALCAATLGWQIPFVNDAYRLICARAGACITPIYVAVPLSLIFVLEGVAILMLKARPATQPANKTSHRK